MKRRSLITAISLLAGLLVGSGHSHGQCNYDPSIVAGPDCGGFGSPTLGRSINEAGQVAGQYTTCGLGASEAFLWDGGPVLITLQRPTGVLCAGAWEISNTGLIAGAMCVTDEGGDRAFLHDGTGFIDLGLPPGAIQSYGRGLNDRGDVVGKWGIGSHAFLYQDGVMIDLMPDLGNPPGAQALDINNAGQIVGWMGDGLVEGGEAFIWQQGKVFGLGQISDGYFSQGRSINEAGQVAGQALIGEFPNATSRAFLWEGGEMIDLGLLPGFEHIAASGINDRGQIVGTASGVGGNPNIETGFIWQNGIMTDLNDLIPANADIHVKWATAINNNGQITGQANDLVNGDVVAFLLTPIDQPLGDLDGDCNVGITDFLMLLSLWGPCPDPCPSSCAADLDGDCTVGITDFLILLTSWG